MQPNGFLHHAAVVRIELENPSFFRWQVVSAGWSVTVRA
jgi:hypothetical protein